MTPADGGTLWVATAGVLSRVKNGRVTTLNSNNGLPCDTVHWVMEDDAHSFWFYMAYGLVRVARRSWKLGPKKECIKIRIATFARLPLLVSVANPLIIS